MEKTIKQIADELGIDKQKVYRWIKKNCINEAHQKNGVMYFDDAVETAIKSAFLEDEAHQEPHHEAHQEPHHDVHQNHINDALVLLLKQELEAKNEQILNMQKLLDQEQQLRMLSEHKVLLLESQNSENDVKEKKLEKKWWFFKKNS